jgi:hypothetical protein
MVLSGYAKASSRKLSMEKTMQTTLGTEQVNASDKEVWSAIRYLDDEPNDALSVALVAGAVVLYVVIPALGWLYFR